MTLVCRHSDRIRCSICGRFIGAESFERDEVLEWFTPDTEFTVESIEFWHKSCEEER